MRLKQYLFDIIKSVTRLVRLYAHIVGLNIGNVPSKHKQHLDIITCA